MWPKRKVVLLFSPNWNNRKAWKQLHLINIVIVHTKLWLHNILWLILLQWHKFLSRPNAHAWPMYPLKLNLQVLIKTIHRSLQPYLKEQRQSTPNACSKSKQKPIYCWQIQNSHVAQGYSQVSSLDYMETFSLVMKLNSSQVLLALATKYDLEIH
jgi:hypothetical protein